MPQFDLALNIMMSVMYTRGILCEGEHTSVVYLVASSISKYAMKQAFPHSHNLVTVLILMDRGRKPCVYV